MGGPILVEFIDSATNEKLSEKELRHLKLLRLYRALELLGREWTEGRYTEESVRRFLVFHAPEDFLISYTVEFKDFPSVSCGIGRNVVRGRPLAEIIATIGEQLCAEIRKLKSTSYWQNKVPKMWWEENA